jgi:hypothetical protein
MKLRKPSPAMVVALIALVMASTGSAVAAVNFARNAGAVDGRSAVTAGASLTEARGRLVATARGGADSGRIPGKFLAGVPLSETFGVPVEAPDNQVSAPVELIGQAETGGFGRLTAACEDRNPAAGVENPDAVFAFTNTSGSTMNLARRAGVGDGEFAFLPNAAADQFRIGGQNTFTYHLQAAGVNVLIDGVMRQEGAGSASGVCVVYGTVMLVR